MKKWIILFFVLILYIIGCCFYIWYNNIPSAEMSNSIETNDTYYNQINHKNDDNSYTFYASIEKINGKSLLVEGLSINDINFKGKFNFSIKDTTILLWRNTKIDISDLDVGDTISITFDGIVQESYPAGITNVTKVILLDDEK